MKIYKFYGDNISGGMHGSWFIVIANSKEKAKEIILNKIKNDEFIDIDENWKLDEEVEEIDIKEGIISWDTGDCC